MADQYLFQDKRTPKGLTGIETLVMIGLFLIDSQLTTDLLGTDQNPLQAADDPEAMGENQDGTFHQMLADGLNDDETSGEETSAIENWNGVDADTHDTLDSFLKFVDDDGNRGMINQLRAALTASIKATMGDAYDDCPITVPQFLQLMEAARVIAWRGQIGS